MILWCIFKWCVADLEYQAIIALRQDNGLLQAVKDDLPQILQDSLQHRLITNISKGAEPGSHTNTKNMSISGAMLFMVHWLS